jgi:dipeptidyl aminopeptidase/acylaminoacyl peptidase
MKSLSVKLGVILIGLITFSYAEVWGADWKIFDTRAGYIFYPRLSNGRALVYCHGGFGKPRYPDLPAVYFVNHGWTVFVLKYDEEKGKTISIEEDILDTMKVILFFKEKFRRVDLLGVSRGGFVALQTFVRYSEKIDKCVAVVSPVHMELWERMSKKTWEERYFKGLDDPYEYVEKMSLTERLGLGKKLLLIYGIKDDAIPVSQGIGLSEKTKCKLILVDGNHMLFYRRENQRLAKDFLLI